MKDFLKKVFEAKSLTREEASQAMEKMILGQAPPEQVAAFLGALRAKKETVDEIVGFALTMRKHAIAVRPARADLIDTCGTGGDSSGTFNISTASAFVAAAAGIGVAKHGNRAVSSVCGSYEVVSASGIRVEQEPQAAARAIDRCGFAFLFAPAFNPAMKNVAPIRTAIGVRTVFNLLGPLNNPAAVKRQVLGVFDPRFLPLLAQTLLELGSQEAIVVSSEDGLDEISLAARTFVAHLRGGGIERFEVTPEDVGLKRAPLSELKGGDAQTNAAIMRAIFSGEVGPKSDAVALNAGAALWIGGKAGTFREGVALARELISSGKALAKLEEAKALP